MEKIKAYGICLYKYKQNSIELLLCKSVKSFHRWGFLKGVALLNEQPEETAIREFFEESGILVDKKNLENYYFQKNELKNIGIYLVNYNSIFNADRYFLNGVLQTKHLSHENSEVRFFDINQLPIIKKKQSLLTKEIVKHFNGDIDEQF